MPLHPALIVVTIGNSPCCAFSSGLSGSSEFLAVQGWQLEHDDYQMEGVLLQTMGLSQALSLGSVFWLSNVFLPGLLPVVSRLRQFRCCRRPRCKAKRMNS
jgi:hypothetical protein